MAAIAESQMEIEAEKYLAGVWLSSLAHGLLWRNFHWNRRRPDFWRAPCWLWASVEQSMSFIEDSEHIVSFSLNIVSYHIQLGNPRVPYGSITGGYLIMKGRLQFAHLSLSNSSWNQPLIHPYSVNPITTMPKPRVIVEFDVSLEMPSMKVNM